MCCSHPLPLLLFLSKAAFGSFKPASSGGGMQTGGGMTGGAGAGFAFGSAAPTPAVGGPAASFKGFGGPLGSAPAATFGLATAAPAPMAGGGGGGGGPVSDGSRAAFAGSGQLGVWKRQSNASSGNRTFLPPTAPPPHPNRRCTNTTLPRYYRCRRASSYAPVA